MRALTPADVAPLYKRKYWDKIKGDDLPNGVDYVVFDAAINSGPGRAAKWLQACVGVEPDGGIGPKTLSAVAGFDVGHQAAAVTAQAVEFAAKADYQGQLRLLLSLLRLQVFEQVRLGQSRLTLPLPSSPQPWMMSVQ